MLIDARARHSRKKITRTTAATLKTCNSIMSNPEVEAFYDKLGALAQELPETLLHPLNLVHWQRTKYRPTESENRIRIENRVSLKRAADEKIRPRVKPVKRVSQSVELLRNEPGLDYREFYQQLLKSQSLKRQASEPESEEEQPLEPPEENQGQEGFRFKQKLAKYHRVTSFIQERINSKVSEEKDSKIKPSWQRTAKSRAFSNSPASKFESASKTCYIAKDPADELKIDSILKKWNPGGRGEKKIERGDRKGYPRKRYSYKDVSKPAQLFLSTHRQDSDDNMFSGHTKEI